MSKPKFEKGNKAGVRSRFKKGNRVAALNKRGGRDTKEAVGRREQLRLIHADLLEPLVPAAMGILAKALTNKQMKWKAWAAEYIINRVFGKPTEMVRVEASSSTFLIQQLNQLQVAMLQKSMPPPPDPLPPAPLVLPGV